MTAPEEQPLLAPIEDGPIESTKHTEVILDFDPNGDPENPREWPTTFKWFIVLLLACIAFTVTFTCISVVPIASHIVEDLDNGRSSSSASTLLVTIWELGEAAGPLLIAPLSEIFGRYPVINVCNILFIGASILAALSQSTTLFIAARFLTGLMVASNVLSPAIIGDMFVPDQRGSPMSLLLLAPLLGGAVGPAISGAISQTLGWREALFIAAALALACEILFLTCCKETYKIVILRRKVARSQHDAGLHPGHGANSGEAGTKLFQAIIRPAMVLSSSGVLIAMCLFGSVAFSYFYVISTSLPGILLNLYGFTPALTGSAFISFSVGSCASVLLCNYALDRIYVKLRAANKGQEMPEYRLPLVIFGGFTLPLALIAYGWIAHFRLPVWLLLISVGLQGFTLLLAFIPLSAYVVDACGLYSASAMTGVTTTRAFMGTFLPLTTDPLVERFGYGWGFMFLAALSFCLAPIPVFVFRYGKKWRQRSEYTKDAQ